MDKTRRILSLFLALVMVGCLSGCAGETERREIVRQIGYTQVSAENDKFIRIVTNLPADVQAEITVKNQEDKTFTYQAVLLEEPGTYGVIVEAEGLYEITVQCPGYRKTESAVRVGDSAVYFLSIQCEAK